MESFSEANTRFRQFLRDQGLPVRRIWVGPGDVIVCWRRLFVYGVNEEDRLRRAEERFRLTAQKDAGVALEAICIAGHAICCFVYSPERAEEAAAMMFPRQGAKLSVPASPVARRSCATVLPGECFSGEAEITSGRFAPSPGTFSGGKRLARIAGVSRFSAIPAPQSRTPAQ